MDANELTNRFNAQLDAYRRELDAKWEETRAGDYDTAKLAIRERLLGAYDALTYAQGALLAVREGLK